MTDPRELLANATPRPWEADKHGDVWPLDPDYERVARCEAADADNAALIVAAVNEYEALRDIESGARAYTRALHRGDNKAMRAETERSTP